MRAALLLAFACCGASAAQPDYAGFLLHSVHLESDAKRHLTNNTPGVLLSWRAGPLDYVDVSLFSNSQGFPGAYVGLASEWSVAPRVYVALGGGLTWGYRRYHYDYGERGGGIAYGHDGTGYAYAYPLNPRFGAAVLARARFDMGGGFSLVASYMPAGTLARLGGSKNPYFKDSDTLSIGVVWSTK